MTICRVTFWLCPWGERNLWEPVSSGEMPPRVIIGSSDRKNAQDNNAKQYDWVPTV